MRWIDTRRLQIAKQNQLANAVRTVHERYDHEEGADPPHCFHNFRGPLWMVVPDGQVLQKCCHCETTRLIHFEHARYG